MTFKVGSCAVVLARKYVMILLGFLLLIGGLYVFRAAVPAGNHDMVRGPDAPLSWDEFLRDCGPKSHLGAGQKSNNRLFEEKYHKKTFRWRGKVRQIREGVDIFFWHTKCIMLVKMEPSRFPTRDYPDVALLFGEERNKDVANLAPGDLIEFEGTMAAHGRRGDPEVMILWSVTPIENSNATSIEAGIEGVTSGGNLTHA